MKHVVFAACMALIAGTIAAQAKGGFFPTYHPTPCEGGECRGDDAKSGLPCQGLLCTFGSANSLQKPVTATEAAEAQARAAAATPAPAAAPAPAAEPVRKKRKAAAKSSKPEKKPVAATRAD